MIGSIVIVIPFEGRISCISIRWDSFDVVPSVGLEFGVWGLGAPPGSTAGTKTAHSLQRTNERAAHTPTHA